MVEPTAVALDGVDRAKVGGGSTVLVTGAGAIGALVILICNAMGASKIFVSEPSANRRRLIESLGAATAVLDPKAVNVIDYIRANTEEGLESIPRSSAPESQRPLIPGSRPRAIAAPSCRPACV
jgi:(R,R)-butanediol dehydrogenase/meso-butanediol dehydrogenase/diacetyl reductase